MGKVYKAFDKEINAKVALKLIRPEIAVDKKKIERFRNELKVARDISHKNICRMYDLNKEVGIYFITMEYVSGEDLKSMIRMSGQLGVETAVHIAKQVCEGLGEAHRLGVIHRDLKPSNIMVDRMGNAKIMDFGIARSLEAKGVTGEGVMIGTPEYMSPEQAEGKEADRRSDIYALGVILYEMLTGRAPFEGDTSFAIAMKHKSEIPRDPRELNVHIPEELSRVILRCLEKNKEKRYQTADAFCSELARIEERIPLTEKALQRKKPFTPKETTIPMSLRKLFIPALGILVLIMAAVVIWRSLPQKEKVPILQVLQAKPSLAVLYFKNNTGDKSLDYLRSTLSDLFITELQRASRHLAVLSPESILYILNRLNLYEAKSYSSENLKKVYTKAGVTYIVTGSISMAGDNLRLIYDLKEAGTGKSIGSDRADGVGEAALYSMVDDLSRKILGNLGFSPLQIASRVSENREKAETSSAQAYKYYQLGRHLERRYYENNEEKDFTVGVEWLQKAIQEDPIYARAY